MRSPIRWFGGKGNFTQHLLPLIPDHKCYVEVFGGGASLLFAKPPSKVEVYNDIDGDVVAFFRLFHDAEAMEEFKRKCYYTPYSRGWYLECSHTWQDYKGIERIYRWYIKTYMTFGGKFDRHNASFGKRENKSLCFQRLVASFDKIIDRLHHVQIECDTWERIIDRYDDSSTLFYLDPPYLPETRSDGGYAHEMTFADHKRLTERLESIQGKALLSGYANKLYDSLKWQRNDTEVSTHANHNNGIRSDNDKRTECLWRNYEIQPTLF